jgi:hypothetical protein
MPRKAVLSVAQQAALTALPAAEHDLRLHYTLSENDLSIIRGKRGAHNRLFTYTAASLISLLAIEPVAEHQYMRDAGVVHASFYERMNVRAVRQLVEICNNLYTIMSQPLADFRDPWGPLVGLRVRNEDFWSRSVLSKFLTHFGTLACPARRVFFAANCSHARELSLGVNQESRRVVVQKQ